MARYKILKSVAHNFAHSFVSVMNYSGRDYTMCHLVRRSKLKGKHRFHIDVLTRSVEPVDLVTREIAAGLGVSLQRVERPSIWWPRLGLS